MEDELRYYQEDAVVATYDFLRKKKTNPCIVLPTAAGKTHVIRRFCYDAVLKWGGRVIILAHVKELLEQAAKKLWEGNKDLDVGIYSAGLKSRNTQNKIIVAGIQSVYKRACDLGKFDIAIIDEAHLIPPDGEGMYQQMISDMKLINPRIRFIGLTATAFRMKSGMICAPENILNEVCYEIGVKELIRDGFLCPLVTKNTIHKVDTSKLHIRAGEFVKEEVNELMNQDDLVNRACAEIVERTKNRNSVLIFGAGVPHAEKVASVLHKMTGQDVGTVFGETVDSVRKMTLSDFGKGSIKYLVNVNVLTTGYDCPRIDCVGLLGPTNSPGKYYQEVGRGFRLDPSKENCLVLDYGGNVERHGPVDAIVVRDKKSDKREGGAPVKECPECQEVVHAGYSVCPDCGHQFPPPDSERHDGEATTKGILSGQESFEEKLVSKVSYTVHTKRGADDDAPKTLKVEYRCGLTEFHAEWVCFEHTGWARKKAEDWWRKRAYEDDMPATSSEAALAAECGALREPVMITLKTVSGEKYDRISGYQFEANDQPKEPEHVTEREAPKYVVPDDEEIPF